MESKCQKCFYYQLCVQPDYVIEEGQKTTNHYCGIHEKGIPLNIWKENEECDDFIEK